MSLQFANENFVLVIAGCSGSGKSTVAIRFLNNARLTCRFIFDPSGEYAQKFQRRACSTTEELNAAIPTGWVIYDPKSLFPGADIAGTDASKEAFAKFCEWAWMVSRKLSGQKILMADEIWQFCSPNFIPISLRAIIQNGRKNGIGLLATTQKPNKMNETILGEATEFIGFRLAGKNLLKSLEDNIEIFPTRELPNLILVDKVRSQFIAQNLRSGGLKRYELDFRTWKIRAL